MTIKHKKEEMVDLLKQIVEQYNKNATIQTQLKEKISEVQGAIKVLNELEPEEDVDTDTDSETT